MEDDNDDIVAEDDEEDRPDTVSYVSTDFDGDGGGGDLSNQSSNSN